MGHTRLKRKKIRRATQKVQRGGNFDKDTPTKKQQQGIDSFHDFWPLMRGIFEIHLKKSVNGAKGAKGAKGATVPPAVKEVRDWHLMRAIIRWLLINYSVPSLNVIPETKFQSLLRSAPTYNFNFSTYTNKSKPGDLFFTSLLAPSKIEPKGRAYIKIPQAADWTRTGDLFANFRSLFDALFPGTNQNVRNQSTMYIVCDSGPGKFRDYGNESIAAAIEGIAAATATNPAMLTARISARISIAGAIAALAKAIDLGGPAIIDQIKRAMATDAYVFLEKLYPKSSAPKLGKSSSIPTPALIAKRSSYWCTIIGLIYITPFIIEAATNVVTNASPATIVARAVQIEDEIKTVIMPTAPPRNQLPPHTNPAVNAVYLTILVDPATGNPIVDVTNVELLAVYNPANMLKIILSATHPIAETIRGGVVDPDRITQIIAAANKATTLAASAFSIGPFVKEISTPQRSADSATTNPQPSTIPGDVYPIIYEFVKQARSNVGPPAFPEPKPAIATDDLFYSDANLYTDGRYEIRFERHQWSPATGLGFKLVIGRIQAPSKRYEVEFGMVNPGTPGAYFNTLGPSAALLAACCLKRVLQPELLAGAAAPVIPSPITHIAINQSLNYLLQGPNRTNIIAKITPLLDTVANNMFTNRSDMFHPYLHFKGNVPSPTSPFYELPPELWFDIKRGGDRDQVMAAYQLSLLTNPDGSPKYPYLVFVTGDELCAAIAVKKGLATIYQTKDIVRYWPKGIVYRPTLLAAPFTPPRPQLQNYRMYTILPAGTDLQYSIQSWGGNQMKGGDYYTMSTPDEIEDGYGNKYDLYQLQAFLEGFKQRLLQQLQQPQQQLQQQLQGQLTVIDGIIANYLVLFNNAEDYVFIYNTQENIQKIRLMNFGTEVDIDTILFALSLLPQIPILFTIVDFRAILHGYNIITNPQIIASAAQFAAARAAQVAQAEPQWVDDMISIFSFTSVPNETEDDPYIIFRPAGAALNEDEMYAIQIMASRFGYLYKQYFPNEENEENEENEVVRLGKRSRGGKQLNPFIKKYGIEPIFRDVNKRFRNDTITETPDNPIYMHVQEEIERYLEMPNPASIMASFYTSCNMIPYNKAISKTKKPTYKLQPLQKTGQMMTFQNLKMRTNLPKEVHTTLRIKSTANQSTTNQSTAKANNLFTPLSQKPKQPQYEVATTGAPASTIREGGKRHTKKTRRTQKNHKRKKHGTQRKRSH